MTLLLSALQSLTVAANQEQGVGGRVSTYRHGNPHRQTSAKPSPGLPLGLSDEDFRRSVGWKQNKASGKCWSLENIQLNFVYPCRSPSQRAIERRTYIHKIVRKTAMQVEARSDAEQVQRSCANTHNASESSSTTGSCSLALIAESLLNKNKGLVN